MMFQPVIGLLQFAYANAVPVRTKLLILADKLVYLHTLLKLFREIPSPFMDNPM